MKFDIKEKILRLSAEELVRTAAAHYGNTAEEALPAALPLSPEEGRDSTAYASFALPAFSGVMSAAAALCEENGKTVLVRRFAYDYRGDEDALQRRRLRALGFALVYAFAGETLPSFRFLLVHESGECEVWEEAPDAVAVEQFFARLLTGLLADGGCEIERVTERLPTMLSVPFPYADVREGQRDMMGAVYSAAKGGEVLFATAPTGTGKTMAVLFPAVRAMGHGHVQKVFYLTPKNTSARAACDAVRLLASRGMRLRALHLVAKEKLCAARAERGDCAGCPRRRQEGKALRDAVLSLLSERQAVVTARELSRTAMAAGVCPYRLALAYSRYSDIVIGDYNYLFDPHAAPAALYPAEEERLFLVDEAHNLPDRAREMFSGGIDSALLERATALYGDTLHAARAMQRLSRGFTKTVDILLRDSLRTDPEGSVLGFDKSANFPLPFAGLLEETLASLSRDRIAHDDPLGKEKRAWQLFLGRFLEKLSAYDSRFLTYAQREGERRTLRFFCIDPSERVASRLSLGSAAVFFSATLSPIDYYRSVLCGGMRTVKLEVPSPFESGALCVGIMDKISVRASSREQTLSEIVKVIITAMKTRRGNYMVFCPSYEYLDRVAAAFHAVTPKTPMAVQKPHMTTAEREAFLANFKEDGTGYFVGFCVSGGIFSEGVDLVGRRLIGTVVVGVGLPGVSAERELISAYYGDLFGEGKEYAYLYPGLNRILQAAGRVIRREEDRGIAVLIDDRLRDEACRRVFPPTWRGLKYVGDRTSLTALLTRFWQEVDRENDNKS